MQFKVVVFHYEYMLGTYLILDQMRNYIYSEYPLSLSAGRCIGYMNDSVFSCASF